MASLHPRANPWEFAAWPTGSVPPELCESAALFFATWLSTAEELEEHASTGAGIYATEKYIRILTNNEGNRSVTDGSLVKLYVDWQTFLASSTDPAVEQDWLNNIIRPIYKRCGPQVCKALDWSGNGDLAGIGVFASYYIEAMLATIFLGALVTAELRGWKQKPFKGLGSKGIWERVLDAFTGTLSELRTSAMIFSVVIMCASFNSLALAKSSPDKITTYEIITAALVSAFSFCASALLFAIGSRDMRRKNLQRALILTLWVLLLVIVNLAIRTDPNENSLNAGSVGNSFEIYCLLIDNMYRQTVRIAANMVGPFILLYIGLIYVGRKQGWGRYRFFLFMEQKPHIFAAILAWAFMWAFLAVFTNIRATVINVAGPSDKSNEWSFGQIIAVTAWAPLMLNFIYTVKFGIEEGQTANVAPGYEVRAVNPPETTPFAEDHQLMAAEMR